MPLKNPSLYDSIIEKCKENFSDHEIKIIHQSEDFSRIKFSRPNTWMYGMFITTADNLIVVNGDCGTLVLEPGYGRNGLSFLKGSIDSAYYLLGKTPFKNEIKEYSPEYAKSLLYERLEEYKEEYPEKYTKFKKKLKDIHLDDWDGEQNYYRFCHENDFDDDPWCPKVLNHFVLNIIAGLKVMVKKMEE